MEQQTQETGSEKAVSHEVKIERGIVRSFMIPLSDSDIAVRAREVARLLRRIEEKTEERDRAKKHANGEIDELEASVKRLSNEVHDGEERREIQCERRFIYRLGVVQVVRTDTGEVVDERAMDAHERQTELPLENGSSDDEQHDDADDSGDDESSDDDSGGDDDAPPRPATAKKKRSKKN
jgi:hypothetical protein